MFINAFFSVFFLRALLAGVMIGLCAPLIGIYLVQKKLSLLGEGIGHIALSGVALGWLIGSFTSVRLREIIILPCAILAAVVAAFLIELLQKKDNVDTILAVIFYGGLAGSVVLIGLSNSSSSRLNSYLFGSIATVSWVDILDIALICIVVLAVIFTLRPILFSITNDSDFSYSIGLRVRFYNYLISLLAAVLVAVGMQIIGALLISALMIIPVASASLFGKSFRATLYISMAIGAISAIVGLLLTAVWELSPGATIVLVTIGFYLVSYLLSKYSRT